MTYSAHQGNNGLTVTLDPFRDSHVHPKLRRQVFDLCEGIDLCLSQEPRMAIPALILLYSGIDGMAWVSIADKRDDVTSADFQAWVKQYFLPDSGLPCDELDLYAARCALVHGQIMDSKLARKGLARHICYNVGPGNRHYVPIHQRSKQQPLMVPVEMLQSAFRRSTERFFEQIEQDVELERRVWPRADLYFDEVRLFRGPGAGLSFATIPTTYG